MNVATKALLGWLALFVVMFANGIARVAVLQPFLGEDRARQVASIIGLGLVLLVSWVFVRVTPQATGAQVLGVGVAWLLATLAFEFLFGHFVAGLNWETLLADYNLARGRLWPVVLVGVLFGPWVWKLVQVGRSSPD